MQEIEANLRKVRIHNSIKPFLQLNFISCFKVIKYLMYQTQQINIYIKKKNVSVKMTNVQLTKNGK